MPWNFFRNPVDPEEAIEAGWLRMAGCKDPLRRIRGRVEEEIPPWRTAAREATGAAGGTAVCLHRGSRQIARSPEEILIRGERE